jgi:hypothetical protein
MIQLYYSLFLFEMLLKFMNWVHIDQGNSHFIPMGTEEEHIGWLKTLFARSQAS